MRPLIIFSLIFWIPALVYSQKFKNDYKYGSIGFNINAMNYVGELDPGSGFFSPGIRFTRHNVGFCMAKRVSPRITLRGNLSHGIIEGKDSENASWSAKDIHRKVRNLSFRSAIWELKADAIVDFFSNRGKPSMRADYTPYIFGGIAYFHHNPKAKTPDEMGGDWVALQPLELEGKHYSLNQVAIPVGLGFRYKLGKKWDLAFEMGWRFTFTDYLDDVSSSYLGSENFKDDPLSQAMSDRTIEGLNQSPELENWARENLGYNFSNGYLTLNGYGKDGDQRGDPKRKDWYLVTGFHFTYLIFPKVIRCRPKHREEFL